MSSINYILKIKSWQIGIAQFLFQGFAEDLSQFPDNSFDAVIETLVLCSVSDVSKSLKEIHRILKPSGKFYFFDHIIAPSDEKLLCSIQYLLTKTVCYHISYQNTFFSSMNYTNFIYIFTVLAIFSWKLSSWSRYWRANKKFWAF